MAIGVKSKYCATSAVSLEKQEHNFSEVKETDSMLGDLKMQLAKTDRIKSIAPGFAAAVLVGCMAYYIAGFHRLLDSLVVGIVLGMAVRLFIGSSDSLEDGLAFIIRVFIPVGIVIYGVNLKFHKLSVISLTAWLQIVIGIIIIFGVNYFLCSKLSVSNKTGLLIATGTAICGASAIAFATPAVGGKPQQTGAALLVITVWGLVGIALYPLLLRFIGISTDNYALLCATTLHQTGLVKTAASALGDGCLQTAMTIKMARTCMIIPMIYAISWLSSHQQSAPAACPERSRGETKALSRWWFLWGFVLVGLAFSFIPYLRPYVKNVKPFATLIWAMAMAGLGLTVDLRSTVKTITRPLLLGLILWIAVVVNFFIGYYGMGY